jgi:hypothetical protein
VLEVDQADFVAVEVEEAFVVAPRLQVDLVGHAALGSYLVSVATDQWGQ